MRNKPLAPKAESRPSRPAAILKRTATAALLLLVAFTVFLGATHQGRAAVKTVMFIPHVFEGGPKPLAWFTPDPIVERVAFPIPGGVGEADLYRPPGEGPYAAVLLFLGVAPAGPDDDRVVRLGEALARSNLITLFYWSPIMADERMEPEDIDNLVAAYRYLSELPFVDPERVGMGGFCVGASYTILAAAREPIRDQVAFVNAFGPYYDMRNVIVSVSSETKRYRDLTVPWTPDKLTRKVFLNQLTHDLPDRERGPLREAFRPGGSGAVDAQGFSPEALAIRDLLTGLPRDQARARLADIPPSTLERAISISPSQALDGLETRLLIMHDREDDLVPAYESRRLRDALAGRQPVSYTEFGLFDHVTPEIRLGPWETAVELSKLFRHMHSVLMQAT